MNPFVFKFATSPKVSEINPTSQMRYDPISDMMVLLKPDTKGFVIDNSSIEMATGSLITEAANDPTRDEPTDR